jgi:hypothetical protein
MNSNFFDRNTNPEERMNRNTVMRRFLQNTEEAMLHDLLHEHHHLDDTKEPVFHMTIAPEG